MTPIGAAWVEEVALVGTGANNGNMTLDGRHQVRPDMPAISADDSTLIAGVWTTSTLKSVPTDPNR